MVRQRVLVSSSNDRTSLKPEDSESEGSTI